MDKQIKRVVVKLSGESMADDSGFGISSEKITDFSKSIAKTAKSGVQLSFVLGGGNFYRGAQLEKSGLSRVTADHIGMLGTVMNCLALRDVLMKHQVDSVVMSAIPLPGLCEHYDRKNAHYHMEKGRVVLFAAGIGNPLFTTDTSASLRAIEIDADMLIKATQVDGIYNKDPHQFDDAQFLAHVTYDYIIDNKIEVMDLAAFCQCQRFDIQLVICNVLKDNALLDIIAGKNIGTRVTNKTPKKSLNEVQ